MPRSRNKQKQTRLSFAPAASHPNSESPSSKAGRLANVRYDHPSAPSVVIQRSPAAAVNEMSPKAKKSAASPSPESPVSSFPVKNDTESSDDDEIVTKPRRRLGRGTAPKRAISLDSDPEESDEPVGPSPAKRQRRNVDTEAPHTPRRNSDQAKLDLEEDLEDLQDSGIAPISSSPSLFIDLVLVVKNTRTRGRLANSERSKRHQHLETLRRRRAGNKEQSDAESESESEEESQEFESDHHPTKTPQTALRRQAADSDDDGSPVASDEDLDKYDDDFVLADENDELGVPTGADEIPLEFTRHSYKQIKEYFQDAVEWMVHNHLNPAFSRSSPRFKFAFSKLEDEVRGRAGSQLLSSSWNVEFRRAVMARPDIEVTSYPVIENHPCDACNRSGHPASSDVKFGGKAYSLETLEPLSGEGSDEEQPEDSQERDRDGNILPDEEKRFLIGK
jgi:hypothetical protein